ncbi:uncharacterized protein EV154DRAFT_390890, partial [Mucor mucedo]|uniref:uncharacterized protein n=1 Tax=Mucor mucedo TaxID=29922 RepID=UPI00221F3323
SSTKATKRKSDSSSRPEEPKKQKTVNGYQCPICQWGFQKKYNLDTHIKTHDKNRVKGFSCTDCSMSFARKSHLARHTTTVHEKTKCHVCLHCGNRYTRANNLRKHV